MGFIFTQNKNCAISTLYATLPIGGTSITLYPGEGALFPTSGSWYGVIWEAAHNTPSADATREYILVTSRTSDTLTIVRAQEGTSAKEWTLGSHIALIDSAAKWTELQTIINSIVDNNTIFAGENTFTNRLRLLDNGSGGKEFSLCSDNGVFTIDENTGTENSPVWVPRITIDSNGLYDQSGVGSYVLMSGPKAPVGTRACNASTIDATTYKNLVLHWDAADNFNKPCPYGRGTGTSVTFDADTDSVTWNAHGLTEGTLVYFSATTAPGNVTMDKIYYVRNPQTNSFQISLTPTGTIVDITSAGSAVMAYTSVKLPDWRGKFPRAWANGSTNDPDRASRTDRGDGTTGDFVGTNQESQNLSHTHTCNTWTFAVNAQAGGNAWGGGGAGATALASGGNESRPINMTALFAIRY